MKAVHTFKCKGTLSAAETDKLRERLKRQISEGLLVLDETISYRGAVIVEEETTPSAPRIAEDEPARGGGLMLTRRVSSPTTFAELKAAIKSGHGSEVIRPFDEFDITLMTGETVTVVCGGFVSDTRARFVFKDCLADAGQMNDGATNAGGYFKSKARKHILEDIYPALPPELREVIEPRELAELIDGELVEYADPLWMPSATDVFGDGDYWLSEPDSVQLEIFKTERDRVKMRGGETAYWWLRSPRASYATYFVYVDTGGTVNNGYAHYSLGRAPGFDL